jgi:hypothetical protein
MRFLYLVLGMIFLALTIAAAIWRRDLRRGIIVVALFGAVWGPISEYWFFRDYWHPGSVVGNPVLEDVIYGAGISATASWIYKVVARRTSTMHKGGRTHYREFGAIVVLYIVAMMIFEVLLGINSILVSIGVYVIAAAYIILRRHDLWAASLGSALLMGVVAITGYGVGMNFLVPEPSTLSHLWLLYRKPLGITILGYVPLTEVMWYTAWGLLLGILYEFATGRQIARLQAASPPEPDRTGLVRPSGSPESPGAASQSAAKSLRSS